MTDDQPPHKAPPLEQHEQREQRATRYFEQDLQGQRRWYSQKASGFKWRAEALSFLVISAGILTTFFAAISKAPWVATVTASLGALIALTEGWQRIARYGERWMAYRIASERMKRERRLYVNGAAEYREAIDEDETYLRFVEAVEAIIAEEQQIYWPNRNSETNGNASSMDDDATGEADGQLRDFSTENQDAASGDRR